MEVTVLLIEPDPARRTHFERCLTHETDLVLISSHSILVSSNAPVPVLSCDVLLLDADRTPVLDVRFWAEIHLLLPTARIIAFTDGKSDQILEAVLAAGLTGLLYPHCDQTTLLSAIRRAAQGVISLDPSLIEHAKAVLLAPLTELQARFGGLTIDLHLGEVMRWGQRIHLTPLEFAVLAYLARQRGRIVPVSELLTGVWLAPPANGSTLAQVHNCIKRIRQKIEPDVQHPRYLLSERGWGYWLQDPTLPQHDLSFYDSDPSHALPFETDMPPKLIDN